MLIRRIASWGPLFFGLVILALPALAVESDQVRSPLGQDYPVFQPGAVGGENVDFSDAPEPDADLTLTQALRLTMRYSADLASSAWEVRAREGEQRQAGLLPNPELSMEAENFAGDNSMSGYDSAETTIAISQLLEMGGKRQKRSLIADLGRQLALWDHERKRLDILTEVTKAYVDVVAGQQRVAQTIVLGELAGAVHRAVRERVEAGKVSPLELTRAGVELSAAHLSSLKARRALKSARKTLVSFWGASDARFGRAIDGLKTTPVLPPFELLVKAIGSNPDLARWTTALKQKQIESDLAKAEAVPDVTVSVGARNFRETGDNALVAVLEVPLMFFDRNQGGRQQALADVQRIRREQQAAQTRIRTALSTAYQEFMSADDELLVLVKEMLPGAEQAFKAANLGYREGKFGFLEMVDAQRTLFEVRGQYVASLATYHKAKADIERLIARPLAGFTTESNSEK